MRPRCPPETGREVPAESAAEPPAPREYRIRLLTPPAARCSRPPMVESFDGRLARLGIELPPVSRPVGNYLGCKRVGDLLFVGGHGPVTASGAIRGKVGVDLDLEAGRAAARATALSMLA